VLSILGIAGVFPTYLAAMAVIGLGAILLFQGANVVELELVLDCRKNIGSLASKLTLVIGTGRGTPSSSSSSMKGRISRAKTSRQQLNNSIASFYRTTI
jgi:hypothetical protein